MSLFLWLVLLALAYAVAGAEWAEGLGRLPTAVTVGFWAGALAAGPARRWPRLRPFLILLALLGSALLSFWLLTPRMDPRLLTWRDRFVDLWIRWRVFRRILRAGGTAHAPLLFLFALQAVAALLAFWSAWTALVLRRPLWTLLPLGVLYFLNQAYLLHPSRGNFALFLLAGLAFLARFALWEEAERWQRLGVQVEEEGWVLGRVLNAALAASFLLVLGVSLLPPPPPSSALRRTWDVLTDDPWGRIRETWERAFGSNTRGTGASGSAAFSPAFLLGGTRRLSDDPVFRAEGDLTGYWRILTYDRYTGQGWIDATDERYTARGLETRQAVPANVPLPLPTLRGTRGHQRITLLRPLGRALPIPGQPLRVSLGTVLEVGWTRATGPSGGWRTNYEDWMRLESQERLEAGVRYEVAFLQPLPSEQELRAAGEAYPAWVRARYLQLPPSLEQARERWRRGETQEGRPGIDDAGALAGLAAALANQGESPYDRARAVEAFLRDFPYTDDPPPVPPNRDFVAAFLFDTQTGYCDYYASAMVVLLRLMGIPARLAAGYAGGDAEGDTLLIRERHAHSWPEVYFPGWGWVPFEPTPLYPVPTYPERPPLERRPQPPAAGLREDEENPLDRIRDLEIDTRGDAIPDRPFGAPAPALTWPLRLLLSGLLLFLLLPLLGAGVLWLARLWALRRLRGPARAYGEVELWIRLAGLGPKPAWTPTETAAAAARLVPEGEETFRAIARAFAAWRYGGRSSPVPSLSPSLRGALIGRALSRRLEGLRLPRLHPTPFPRTGS